MSSNIFISNSEQDTHNFAHSLAKKLIKSNQPQIITLAGDLGAGKTTFVRGFVSAFQSQNNGNIRVKSPTYAYAHTYDTNPPVNHLDLYRLSNSQEAYELGLLEYLEISSGFSIIEWPEKIVSELPKDAIQIQIKTDVSNQDFRQISIN